MSKNNVSTLSSTHSTEVALNSVRKGIAGLNQKRTNMLLRVPNSGDWSKYEKNSISPRDIAFLSAKTNHEFAILRGKHSDILFHGVHSHCNFTDELVDLLKEGKLMLVAHSHPDYDRIVPSEDDYIFLKTIGQKESIIISWITRKEIVFGDNCFDI